MTSLVGGFDSHALLPYLAYKHKSPHTLAFIVSKQPKCAYFNINHDILRANVNMLILRKGEADVTID